MSKYLKLFSTDNDRVTYEGGNDYIEPYVSYVEGDNSVHYNKPPFFCKLTLQDGSTVDIEGSGEVTEAMVSIPYKSTLVSAEIGALCTSIGQSAFGSCSSLSSIAIPNSVTSIGGGAFSSCSSLTSVTIGNGVTSIVSGMFTSCSSLTNIEIPDSVTSIASIAFGGCTNLTTITIGSGVTSIDNSAFSSCNSLRTIISHIMEAPTLSNGTFSSVANNGTLYVPIGSSGYETWMNDRGNLGYRNWTKVEQ